jgi:hypothetical protein
MVDMSLRPQVDLHTHIYTHIHTYTHVRVHNVLCCVVLCCVVLCCVVLCCVVCVYVCMCVCITVLGNCKQGTNVTIHVMYLNLLRMHKLGQDIPDTCYLQLDNTAKQCKSRYKEKEGRTRGGGGGGVEKERERPPHTIHIFMPPINGSPHSLILQFKLFNLILLAVGGTCSRLLSQVFKSQRFTAHIALSKS